MVSCQVNGRVKGHVNVMVTLMVMSMVRSVVNGQVYGRLTTDAGCHPVGDLWGLCGLDFGIAPVF